MSEILKSWVVEFKKVRLPFGESEKQHRICPYCRDSRPIGANTVKLTDRFCPNCGKAVKIKEEK